MGQTDYKPTEETRQLWKIQLEACVVLLDYCRNNNLKIWAGFGTLLGAARHGGFVPWDDDVDFVMMRQDYDVLMRMVKSGSVAFPEPYAFDDKDISVLRLRRNDTTMTIPYYRWGESFNNGVWLDIFPLDAAPEEITPDIEKEYKKLSFKVRGYQNARWGKYAYCISLRNYAVHSFWKMLFTFVNIYKWRDTIENHLRFERGRFSGDYLWNWLCLGQLKDASKIARYKKEWFNDTVMLPFEDIDMPCPVGWKHILELQYGDWQTPIMGSSLHEGAEFIPNKPYKDYIEEKLREMSWWQRFKHTH